MKKNSGGTMKKITLVMAFAMLGAVASANAQQQPVSSMVQSRHVNADKDKCVQDCRTAQRRAGRPVLRDGTCMRQCGLR
jgi:hypothetical protein